MALSVAGLLIVFRVLGKNRRDQRVDFLSKVQISCFFFSYLVAFLVELYQVLRQRTILSRLTVRAMTAAGVIAHTAYLLTRSRELGGNPLMTSGQDWLLVLAWMGAVLYLVLLVAHSEFGHGLFMVPTLLLLVTVAVFVRDDSAANLQQLSARRWGMLHAASLVFGMAAVFGVTISALMYLLHYQKLRSRASWLRRLQLPSLEQLTSVNRWMVIASVPFLTIGLITGFILFAWSADTTGQGEIKWTDPTIITTMVVWLAMVGLLIHLAVSRHQSGKAVAQMSLLSGGFLLMTFFGPMLLQGSGKIRTFHGSSKSEKRVPENAEPDSWRSAEDGGQAGGINPPGDASNSKPAETPAAAGNGEEVPAR